MTLVSCGAEIPTTATVVGSRSCADWRKSPDLPAARKSYLTWYVTCPLENNPDLDRRIPIEEARCVLEDLSRIRKRIEGYARTALEELGLWMVDYLGALQARDDGAEELAEARWNAKEALEPLEREQEERVRKIGVLEKEIPARERLTRSAEDYLALVESLEPRLERVADRLTSFLRDPAGFRRLVCDTLASLQRFGKALGAFRGEAERLDELERLALEPAEEGRSWVEWIRDGIHFIPILGDAVQAAEASFGVTIFGRPLSREEQKALWVGVLAWGLLEGIAKAASALRKARGSKARGRFGGDTSPRVPLASRRRPDDWTPDEAAKRIDDLKRQGHGPEMHEGQVKSAHHDARVLNGTNPATGKPDRYTYGKYAGQLKEPPKKSSSFRSNEAYAQAEAAARRSPEFKALAAAGRDPIYVKDLKLSDAIGADYLRHVEGRTTIGVKAGATRAADFTDSTVFAKYRWNGERQQYDLETLFPEAR